MKKRLTILLCAVLLCAICIGAIIYTLIQNTPQRPPSEDDTPNDSQNNTQNNTPNNTPNNTTTIRYTVTPEEWEALINEKNYTSEIIENGVSTTVQKHTENALYIDGETLIVFTEDGEYRLEETEDGWLAYDCSGLNYELTGLLETVEMADFEYSETEKAYLYKYWEDYGATITLRFENGLPVSMTLIDNEDPTQVLVRLTRDIGTTVINIPEYEIVEDSEVIPPVSEEVWNSFAFETNFTLETIIVRVGDYYMEVHYIKSTGNALMLDDDIFVLEGGKYYRLEETANGYIATESELLPFVLTTLLDSFSFSDFEYELETGLYMRRTVTPDGEHMLQQVEFDMDGNILSYSIFGGNPTGNPEFDGLTFATIYNISEIGTTVIEVPEYTINQ